jgi:hypothetical protein
VVLLASGCASSPTPQPSGSGPTDIASTASPQASHGQSEPSSSAPAASTVRAQRLGVVLPAARSRAVALAFGSTVLVCGGLVNGRTTGSILRLTLPGGPVRAVGRLAAAVHDAAGATIDGLGLVIGGGAATAEAQVQAVSASGIASIAGDLPTPRADLAAVAIDGGTVLVIGGGTPSQPAASILTTPDGTSFRSVGTLRVGVRYPAVATVGGVVYVVGGITPTGPVSVVQALDLATGVVRIVARLPHPIEGASAFAIDGRILVAGGRSGNHLESTIWSLDPATGAVSTVGRLPDAVANAASIVVDGVGYLIGGEGANGELASIIAISLD